MQTCTAPAWPQRGLDVGRPGLAHKTGTCARHASRSAHLARRAQVHAPPTHPVLRHSSKIELWYNIMHNNFGGPRGIRFETLICGQLHTPPRALLCKV